MKEADRQTSNGPAALTLAGAKLLACVHCGLCLEACPTYVHTGDENDGPRGRIYLMRAVEERRLDAASPAFSRHIDRCLGCRACESACPAGVEYGQLLEAARSDIARAGTPKGWTGRALRFVLRRVWLRPRRLRAAFALARLFRDSGAAGLLINTRLARALSPRLEFALALLDASSAPKDSGRGGDEKLKTRVKRRAGGGDAGGDGGDEKRVLLFKGCATEELFARVNEATARVLAANNYRPEAPRGQVCCGALHAHAGDLEGARLLARHNLEAFADAREAPVVSNAGGCGAMLLSYAHLLAGDPACAERAARFSRRVCDVSQQLAAGRGPRGLAAPDDENSPRVTYDASCHLLHGQRAAAEPLSVLEAAVGTRFTPLEGADVCCGGAGVYNLLQPELSARVLGEKLARVRETGARVLATGNPGCHMQIGAGARLAGMRLRVCHPVELLDEAYRRAGIYSAAENLEG